MRPFLLMAGLFAMAMAAPLAAADRAPLAVRGSLTLSPVIALAAGRYAARDPGFVLAVQGSGSAASVRAVANGDALLGMAVREPTAAEREEFPAVTAISWGLDAVVLVVNRANPIAGLTSAQVHGLFTGGILHWREIGGADLVPAPIGRAAGLATLDAFAEAFRMEVVTADDGRGQWFRPYGQPFGQTDEHALGRLQVPVAGTHLDALARVVLDPAAVTFSPIGTARMLAARGGAVRILPLDGVTPNDTTVRDGSYRLARPLYLLVRQPLDPRLDGFLAWLRGPEGHALLADEGFVAP